ncbi:hypothetical protein HU200_030893 [Digitaria exilis]|uniref:Pentatricopeptide repeat-containing protein n=1 Tax=Digitaria exilis TaxID=1010633 RepID=A0A835EQB0_9POAL|nr:hypothetical protein HU200_030893 [Digitaria exilis]CAB3471859.1 unnamed protein product [Digitaria exilis]
MHRLRLRAIASPPLALDHHKRRRLLSAFASDQPIRHHPPIDSAIPWNKLLRDHLARSRRDLALALYRLMRALSPGLPNSYTLSLVLRAAPSTRVASAVHAHALHLGLHAHPDVAGQILAAYARLGRADDARHVFDALPVTRTTLSWNTLISAYSIGCDPDAARAAFARMVASGARPDAVTWTTLLSAHVRCGRHPEVLELFGDMCSSGCEGNAEAVAVALSACPYTAGTALANGRAIHAYGLVKGIVHAYLFVTNSLVCMYGKLGEMEEAEKVFQEARQKNAVTWNALITSYAAAGMCNEALDVLSRMEQRGGIVVPNVVSWSAVIGGFASSGDMEQALELFRQMQHRRLLPNVVTPATVLSACADILALWLGQEVHGHTIKAVLDRHLLVQNGLVNMYGKCGRVTSARKVFDRMRSRDLISWNSMIGSYGMHATQGVWQRAAVCSIRWCKSTISPSMEHYTCMVDLLGRAGLLKDACELIETMPVRPDLCIWGALLNSCRMHGNAAMAEATIAKVLQAETDTTGNQMLITNLYATCGMWDDSKRVRVMTKEAGLKKNPGQSCIEVKNKVFAFTAGNASLPEAEEIFSVLDDLYAEMEDEKHAKCEAIATIV